MNPILAAVLVLGGMGAIFGLVLTFASKKFLISPCFIFRIFSKDTDRNTMTGLMLFMKKMILRAG